MRPSGRQPNQLRPVRIQRGFTRHAEGSVLVEFGETRVLCTASVEERVPPFLKDSGRGCDNISVVAITWQEDAVAAPPPEVEHTQVQDMTATDLDFMRVSDEDIEKAIAELKEALRRSSQQ